MDDLLAEFVAETRDMLAALSGEVVAWEANPDDRARLDTIFRFVHTVKGNCGFFDFPRLEALSHAAEDALADVRAGRREADTRLVNTVLAALDRIEAMTLQIERGDAIGSGGDEDLIAQFAATSDDDIGVLKAKAGPMPGEPTATVAVAEQRTIRLPVELIDQVMSGVSEMVLARNDLARRLHDMGGQSGLEAPFGRLSGLLSEVRDAITRTRMRRIEGLFGTFPRLVRDLSAELGKQVLVEVESGEVELDREMIELIRDPLLHIIRNAIDHGIEPPADRLAAGKHEAGMLTVSARQSGNTIMIGIMDDGRGIDCDALVTKAVEAGIVEPAKAADLSRAAKIELIFEPGLSTAHRVTAISGRGVGMDVVRSNIEKFGGTLEIDTSLGTGTRFLISVPLTLSILPSLTVAAGGQTFAIPRSYVEEIVSTAAGNIELAQVGDRRLLTFREQRLPCVSLAGAMDIEPHPEAKLFVILRLGWGDLYALEVERIFDHQELVIKPLSPEIMACGLFVGCTQLDDGLPVLVLDVATLGYANGIPRELHRPAAQQGPAASDEAGLPVVLLVGLDGARRAIAMSAVEQVERAAADAVRRSGKHAQVVLGEEILPLAGLAKGDTLPDMLPVLRLCAAAGGIAYAAREVLGIERLTEMPRKVGDDPTPLALFGGDPVELIDHMAFAERRAA
jgi:two-component system chemotaxis sensor kinase CheA